MRLDPDTIVLYETASAWFTRKQAHQDWSGQAEAELQAWLRSDPRHQQVYQEIAETWNAFDHVPRPALASDTRRGVSAIRGRRAAVPARRGAKPHDPAGGWGGLFGSRRGFALAALSACLLIGMSGSGAWYWYDNTPRFTEHIQTAHDEQREATLPDGTVLTVNKNSRLDVLFYPRRREVLLAQGEAFFDVASRGGDAFVVRTGNTRVRVVGTAFNVRTGTPTLYVKVREGVVEVSSHGDGRGYTETLQAGEAVAVDSITGAQQRIPSTPDVVGSWRSGQLVFSNAALSEVVNELQGYLDQPIELSGPGVRYRRLSGFANTRNPQDFLEALPQLLSVDVERLPGGGYRIVER